MHRHATAADLEATKVAGIEAGSGRERAGDGHSQFRSLTFIFSST